VIQGRFGNTTGRPYLEGRLAIPRLGIAGNVSFLLDTGADRTSLMQLDGARLSIDYGKLANLTVATGLGGQSNLFIEPAIVAFLDSGARLCVYSIDLLLHEPAPATATLPSLLGRDILRHWIVVCDQPHGLLSADVVHTDYDFPLPPHVQTLPPTPGVAPPPVQP
jgi:hypothetical protein